MGVVGAVVAIWVVDLIEVRIEVTNDDDDPDHFEGRLSHNLGPDQFICD